MWNKQLKNDYLRFSDRVDEQHWEARKSVRVDGRYTYTYAMYISHSRAAS